MDTFAARRVAAAELPDARAFVAGASEAADGIGRISGSPARDPGTPGLDHARIPQGDHPIW
jgi:hypothetical protein